ncbi:MAG: hypothetical protein U1F36_14690 [Planctomycetota bacterium]
MLRIALAALLVPLAAAQSAPRVLADLNSTPTAPSSSNPDGFTRFGAWTFFTADDGVHGRELFRTAGTAASTALFADLRAGGEGSDPRSLTPNGAHMLFFADDGVHGREPWVTDGTPAGTHMVVDLTPGSASTANGVVVPVGTGWIFDVQVAGLYEIWAIDGATGAATRIAGLALGSWVVNGYPNLIALPATTAGPPAVLFAVARGSSCELWRSDGTGTGTSSVATLASWSTSTLVTFLEGDHQVLLSVHGNNGPGELWVSDGTRTGTNRLINYNQAGSEPPIATPIGARTCIVSPFSNVTIVTDGTPAGTAIANLPPALLFGSFLGSDGSALWALGWPWASLANRVLRLDLATQQWSDTGALTPSVSVTVPLVNAVPWGGSYLAFSRLGLFAIDPPTRTASQLAMASYGLPSFSVHFGRILFSGSDPRAGFEPAVTDGTPAGTTILSDLNITPPPTGDSLPYAFTPFGRRTVFATRGTPTLDLWISDGTTAGTTLLKGNLGDLLDLKVIGDRLLILTDDPVAGPRLFTSDGTAAGTSLLRTIFGLSDIGLVARGDEAFFFETDSTHPTLLATDGHSVRTVAVIDAWQRWGKAHRLGDSILFQMKEKTTPLPGIQVALWVSDGSANGTHAVARYVVANSMTVTRDQMVTLGDAVYFVALGAGGLSELWTSDGTAGGTHRVAPLAGANLSTQIVALSATRSHVFVRDNTSMWASDGTASGTTWLPLRLNASYPWPSMTPLGDRMLFDAIGAPGIVPMVSDGTVAGTAPLQSGLIRGGWNFGAYLADDSTRAIFRAFPGQSASVQTYTTDGTSAGTRAIANIELRPTTTSPLLGSDAVLSNGLLFTAITHPHFGIEPHVIDLGASVQRLSDGCGGASRQAELFADLGGSPNGGLAISGRSSAGNSAWLVMSAPPLHPLPFPQAGACVLEVDPRAWVLLGVLPITGGHFAQNFPLPDDPALYGLQATIQAVIAPTSGALGVDFSDGLLLTIGA